MSDVNKNISYESNAEKGSIWKENKYSTLRINSEAYRNYLTRELVYSEGN
jgi:hypothetical protein